MPLISNDPRFVKNIKKNFIKRLTNVIGELNIKLQKLNKAKAR